MAKMIGKNYWPGYELKVVTVDDEGAQIGVGILREVYFDHYLEVESESGIYAQPNAALSSIVRSDAPPLQWFLVLTTITANMESRQSWGRGNFAEHVAP